MNKNLVARTTCCPGALLRTGSERLTREIPRQPETTRFLWPNFLHGVALGIVATARDGYLKKKPGLELSMSSKPGCVTGGPIN